MAQWSIERQNGRRMTQAKMKNIFEIHGVGTEILEIEDKTAKTEKIRGIHV